MVDQVDIDDVPAFAQLRVTWISAELRAGSNQTKNARYDQILHLPTAKDRFSNRGGIVDFYGDGAAIEELSPGGGLTKTTFTYQLSDHYPVWIQIKTDIDGDRFEQIVQNGGRH